MSLSLLNIIRVTVLSALRGLADINTSALALFTTETPIPADFGTSRIYLDPIGVANDFGTSSETYRMAVKVFSQNPNILTGNGYLIVIPRPSVTAKAAVLLGSNFVDFTKLTATDYYIRATLDGGSEASIDIGEIDSTTIETIKTSLNSAQITSAGLIFDVSGEINSARVTLSTIATGATKIIEIESPATSTDGTEVASLLYLSGTANGSNAGTERLKDSILRTYNSIAYFGIITNEKMSDAVLREVSDLVQSLDKLLFVGSNLVADLTGIYKTIKDAGNTHTRCLLYTNSEDDALDFSAGYASRALSINFRGSNTVHTMHLKEIIGMVADPIFAGSSAQTYLDSAKANGVDVIADFGIPKVFTSGANRFFDSIYIELALKLKLTIAGFNYLATTSTKIYQTESGMNGLKGSYRKVLDEFITNGAFAPGAWNSSTTFGSPEDHIRNIKDFGFFVYSRPISLQVQTDRELRIAPLIQIAAKSAGAIHSSDVIVNIEA